MTTMRGRERWSTSVPGVVVLVMAVALPLTADGAEAWPARAPTVSTRLRVAWPREAAQAEAAFVADINGLRADRGLPVLQMRPSLTSKARRWAATMAADRRIRHSRLSAGITGNWHKLGENVGRGPYQQRLHAAFVASATHLGNIVDPTFRYVGVGVVVADGVIFVSQVFMQPSSPPPRRLVRGAYRTATRAAPVRPLHQGRRPPTRTPGLLFRAIH